ncbi:protein-L-isoaspartate O-methyltransferase [Methanocaldococcus infernus ME]|uniref:Protein-L-isoaspartate O-methyltransferase n=1 Tax=Methanocaldococcus infernus (strain DSM 11812 / JCM 15783 / ME) TaxID=573063 RepID=D5VQX0_METIM|nr:protein-L-isoaspartate O-methyltransferase [Methanocaldococcus infernus]ADG12973.1 protein-L-isoaspartate O-methyltransferase [Methanocaldococcus infernus ME]
MDKYELIEKLKREGYIRSNSVEEALLKVPREEFVPEHLKDYAYCDTPLEIGHGQTISAPHMVALMSELLELKPGMKVLEIGTGSGYHAAVTAELVGKDGLVVSIERIPELAERAEKTLRKLGYDNVIVIVGDGSLGYKPLAPYDRIYCTAAAPSIPKSLISQLKDGGKMVIPVGKYMQKLILLEKRGDKIITKDYGAVAFVPLIGEEGFK